MPEHLLSRRNFLQAALAAALPQAGVQALAAQAHTVSPWAGSLNGLRLADGTGKTWQAADFTGRAVLLNFWASWCEPCRAEMPSLQQLADLHGPAKLLVLAINFKESPTRALQFAGTSGITLPVLLDIDGQAARGWGVKVFPTTLTIDRRGQPRHRVQGELDWTGQAAGKLIASLL